MNSKTTIVWGVCADSTGIVQQYADEVERLPGGGVRVETRTLLEHEPASAYADVHSGPMPMLWRHGEQIAESCRSGAATATCTRLVSATSSPMSWRRSPARAALNGRPELTTVATSRFRITEISLTPEAATVGLPVAKWWKRDVVKGNLPTWVSEELDRASRSEHRSRGVLRVHEVGSTISAADEYEQIGRDLGLFPGGYEHRIDPAATRLSTPSIQGGFSASAGDPYGRGRKDESRFCVWDGHEANQRRGTDARGHAALAGLHGFE